MEEDNIVKNSSPKWKRPDEVMKYFRFKQKKRALSSRINGCDNVTSMFSHNSNSEDSFEFPAAKRRNPFATSCENKPPQKSAETTDESGIETDVSSDTTLFLLLNNSEEKTTQSVPRSFANILQHLNSNQEVRNISKKNQKKSEGKSEKNQKKIQKDGLSIPIDWSLKSKLRIMSPESFSWSSTLTTCEEASSITGFVRCFDASDNKKKLGSNIQIDVTANAKFHQCCFYWQHPNIPWLPMFPRNSNIKVNSQIFTSQLLMSQALTTEWTNAFKSLYQLVRVNQCPYFYVIANHFQCLFRAAGVAGIQEIHAIVTPTTRGFRKMLENEGVVFTMPLKKRKSYNEFVNNSENIISSENEDLSGDEGEDWLESLSVDAQEIKKYTMSQKSIDRSKEGQIDGSNESLVLIQGMEIQSFFNLLVNCKSCVTNSGPYAGVPPTLISPNAFLHGTLKYCKIRDCLVQVDGSVFHSIQVEGPILPHGLRQICSLLNKEEIQYSISLSTVKQTTGFTETSKRSQVADLEHCLTTYRDFQYCYGSFHVKCIDFRKSSSATVCDFLQILEEYSLGSRKNNSKFLVRYLERFVFYRFLYEVVLTFRVSDEKKKISTVFLKENLAECGLSENLLNVFCDPDPDMYDNIDSVRPNALD